MTQRRVPPGTSDVSCQPYRASNAFNGTRSDPFRPSATFKCQKMLRLCRKTSSKHATGLIGRATNIFTHLARSKVRPALSEVEHSRRA